MLDLFLCLSPGSADGEILCAAGTINWAATHRLMEYLQSLWLTALPHIQSQQGSQQGPALIPIGGTLCSVDPHLKHNALQQIPNHMAIIDANDHCFV
jgi:hypothetical protein